ncbi:unnamed protein product [Lymnaea stagnalis]|uniref:Uncharacterized protein n=1 Tax=Lymnaea stagnalis TaxID=6523 RepID=A0AAV2IRI0_LYMST
MADKCNIRQGMEEEKEGGGAGGVMVEEDCALACQVIIGVVCVLFLALLLVVVIFCIRRHRAKPSSPSHQSSLTAHPDNAKYYTSCHYACAPVVGRQLQTSLHGDRLETSIIPPGTNLPNGHYQPGIYPQHSCQQINYHLAHHQQPRLINTPYGQVPAHTSSLVVPQHLRYNASHYRKLDGAYSSSSISNSDRSPVYESIGDAESVRERGAGGDMSECEFCECGGDHISEQSGYVKYNDPIILEGHSGDHHRGSYKDKAGHSSGRGFSDKGSTSRCYQDQGLLISHQPDEDPPGPCPPLYMDGYYGDKCPQTLPLRPMRGQAKKREEGSAPKYPDIEPDEISPLNQTPCKSQMDSDGGGKPEVAMRRRPSSGSCYSTNSSPYKEGNYGGQRRIIPALHPHYFVSSPEEIS